MALFSGRVLGYLPMVKQAVYCVAAFFGVNPGEALGALGSVFGGIIGALGAAAAVFLTLSRQRKDERERISNALRTEVMEFCRLAVGHLETCENINSGRVSIAKTDFPFVMDMPKPIIYPATADRIGRLHAPHRVVTFYARIGEIERLTKLIATEPTGVQPYVKNVKLIAHAWMGVCRVGKWFIEETPVEANFSRQAKEHILREIDAALSKAGETFPERSEPA